MMAPSFCCRVLGNADGERCLGAGDHQEVTVVGSYLVLLRLRRSPFESSASESMRCRNLFAPIRWPPVTLGLRAAGSEPGHLVEAAGTAPASNMHHRQHLGVISHIPTTISLQADQSPW